MRGNQPCCCELKTGVTVLAILYILGSVLLIVVPLIVISDRYYPGETKGMAANVLMSIVGSLCLIINVLLLIGARNRDAIKCKIWLIGNPILYALQLVGTILYALYNDPWRGWSSWGTPEYLAMGLELFFGIAVQVYAFWVVWSFIDEIKNPPPPEPVAIVAGTPQYRHPMAGGQGIQYGYGYGEYPPQTPQYPLMAMQGQGGFAPPPPQQPAVPPA